jgi:hypothetical protein
MGLTACQPSLVELEDGTKAIKFLIDSTFLDQDTNKIMGYGDTSTGQNFVGELYMSYDENNLENNEILFITPKEQVDSAVQEIMNNPDKFTPSERPKGKY